MLLRHHKIGEKKQEIRSQDSVSLDVAALGGATKEVRWMFVAGVPCGCCQTAEPEYRIIFKLPGHCWGVGSGLYPLKDHADKKESSAGVTI